MINKDNIKSISYEMPENIMIIHLHKKQVFNGYVSDKVRFKCDYKEFLKKGVELRKYKDENK